MRFLELKIPPPLVALVLAFAGWGFANITPRIGMPDWARQGLALAFLGTGLGCDLAGLWAFRRARTTINPLRPERTRALVTSGIYLHTRNPMYVGMVFVLIAWMVFLAAPVAALGPVAFVLYITRFQVRPEERLLLQHFGDEYRAYMERVPRWL